MLEDLVLKNRSYRRFYGDCKISNDELLHLVDLARNTASTANLQGLKFLIVNDESKNADVFETLSFAGRLKEWNGPKEDERPSAYIVILTDLSVGKNLDFDVGICAQTILLGATEMGYGGCMLGSIKREKMSADFNIDLEKYKISLCIALGKPKEDVRLVDVKEDGDIAYYRDEKGTHYVPKRSLKDILF